VILLHVFRNDTCAAPTVSYLKETDVVDKNSSTVVDKKVLLPKWMY